VNILNGSEKVRRSGKGRLALSRIYEMHALLSCSSSMGTRNRSVELHYVMFEIGRDSRFDLSGQFRVFLGDLRFFCSKAYFNSNIPITIVQAHKKRSITIRQAINKCRLFENNPISCLTPLLPNLFNEILNDPFTH
jgi:hypothetical protein